MQCDEVQNWRRHPQFTNVTSPSKSAHLGAFNLVWMCVICTINAPCRLHTFTLNWLHPSGHFFSVAPQMYLCIHVCLFVSSLLHLKCHKYFCVFSTALIVKRMICLYIITWYNFRTFWNTMWSTAAWQCVCLNAIYFPAKTHFTLISYLYECANNKSFLYHIPRQSLLYIFPQGQSLTPPYHLYFRSHFLKSGTWFWAQPLELSYPGVIFKQNDS